MTTATITEDLFDLDLDIVPATPAETVKALNTEASSCPSLGQTGRPCQCF
ncbi:hypothetical protein Lesp02_78020 [Lentzea sp. NBRC 105346]|nr:hypothetical protein [Lentzea sp. NBRC 105346]GLZ35615.1 hypothetical protein Lesp02_78020 [Lentzea sp. NBRC 105346]